VINAAVAEAPDARVNVLSQTNQGQSAARNEAARVASGMLLAFLDQDDAWTPGKLRLQVDVLRERPEIGFVYGRMDVFLEPGAEWPSWRDRSWLTEPPTGFCPGTLLARREALAAVGGFDTRFRSLSDVDWLVRARRAGIEGLLLDDIVLRYRVHEANQSHDRELFRRELFRALRRPVEERA